MRHPEPEPRMCQAGHLYRILTMHMAMNTITFAWQSGHLYRTLTMHMAMNTLSLSLDIEKVTWGNREAYLLQQYFLWHSPECSCCLELFLQRQHYELQHFFNLQNACSKGQPSDHGHFVKTVTPRWTVTGRLKALFTLPSAPKKSLGTRIVAGPGISD